MTPKDSERRRYYALPRRSRRWVPAALISVWLVIGAVASLLFGGYVFLDETLEEAAPDTPEAIAARKVTKPVLSGEPVNVLLIGSDTRPQEGDDGRSDSLILIRMDESAGFISMLSFPRDLWVDIPGYGTSKINNAYGWGGPELTIRTVSELTGQDINEYVIIDFQGFQSLVDAVGGVFLDIDRRYFNDNSGPGPSYDAIDLEPGYQKLDGVNALDYVRYRHTDSDFARIARQQQFLSDLKRQTNRLGNLTRITEFRKIFGKNIETSIDDVPRFLSLLELALRTEKDRIARVSVDGNPNMRGGASVVLPIPGQIEQAVAEWKEPEFIAGANSGATRERVRPAETVVGVVNGSGRALVADDMAALLRERKWDARPAGNAQDFSYQQSAVFYTNGHREAGKRLQSLVSGNASIAQISSDEAGGSDVIVAVGTDFTGELAPPPPPPPKVLPEVTPTLSLVEPLRTVQRDIGLRVMAPLKVAKQSRVRRVRAYKIGGKEPTVKIVFETGFHKYWGMSMTTLEDPPILEGRTGVIKSGGREYFTYYDGRNLMRLAWQKDGVTYWITNTLDYALTPETIQEIAKSTRVLSRAKLKNNVQPVEIEVELDGSTP